MKIYVDFEPVGRRGEFPPGKSLLDYARQLGVELVNLCGGTGSCGRCVVQIVEGAIPEPTASDEKFITANQLECGFRLACRAVPLSSCKVRVPPESLSAPQRTQIEGEDSAIMPQPVVETYAFSLKPPSLIEENLQPDAEHVVAALQRDPECSSIHIDLDVLRSLSPQLRDQGWRGSAVVRDGDVVALFPPLSKPLGLAVDLGTTKLAVYLMDLETGRTLASRGLMNPQIAYGEDVISRMAFADRDPSQALSLRTMVADMLNQTISEMTQEIGVATAQIVEAVIVANTAMHHLFLGLSVTQLMRSPYVPTVKSALDVKARDIGLRIASGAYVHFLPNVAGYVGSDHVAMVLASKIASVDGVVLALDIGTNTEVCLVDHGILISVSCASGPAFEGAHIKHGMRAADGAIEHVQLVGSLIEYNTIGDVSPVGICGSGILDTLAELHRTGVVDSGGRICDHARVRTNGDGIREFVLVGDEERRGKASITLTQKDIRELQLAKGAMRAGVQVLLDSRGLSEQEIDRVIIAGAFGSYIQVRSAVSIGMLPALPLDRFRQVGNAAGMGAKLSLISRAKRVEAQEIANRITYIELARHPSFMASFAQAMSLE